MQPCATSHVTTNMNALYRCTWAVLLTATAACQQQDSASEAPEVSDAEAVAAVKAAQNREPPIVPIILEPIQQADKDRYNLNDLGCDFTREIDGGAPIALTNDGRAMVKVEGEMIPLAADVGGTPLGTRAWQHYTGKRFAMTLKPLAGDALPAIGQMELRDPWGRIVFGATGRIACAP